MLSYRGEGNSILIFQWHGMTSSLVFMYHAAFGILQQRLELLFCELLLLKNWLKDTVMWGQESLSTCQRYDLISNNSY